MAVQQVNDITSLRLAAGRLDRLEKLHKEGKLSAHQEKVRMFILAYPKSGMVNIWLKDCGV